MIEIQNLTHCFADSQGGVKKIDLVIRRGEFLVIAGANGSGKTTLLRHLNGLLLPTTGSIKVDGVLVSADIRRARRKVGMVFQEADSQIIGETVYADVAFGPENLNWSQHTVKMAVNDALVKMGLSHLADMSPYLLSGGERRRLAVAGVLAMQPEVIVMDEPFANLDFPGVRDTLSQILRLHRDGHTVIVSTHDLEKIVVHTQRLVIMHQGSIVADGTPQEVMPMVEQFDVRMPCAARIGLAVESWLY